MPQLFREQALEFKKGRLQGELLLLPKASYVVLTAFLLLWVALLAFWLFSNEYARKETVSGWVEPQSGVTRVYPDSPGIIKQILVSEGESVTEGQPLAVVNGDRFLVGGTALEAQLLDEYTAQKERVLEQMERTQTLYENRYADLEAQIDAAKKDLELIDQQLTTLGQREDIVADRHRRYQSLLEKNHVSEDDYNKILAQALEIDSERQSLVRAKLRQQTDIRRLNTQIALLPIEEQDQLDQLRTSLGDIARQIARLHGERAYVIKAPSTGVVNNLQASPGQKADVSGQQPLLTIVPEQADLMAELMVPVRAVGFVEAGQLLKIRYDAFPYQKFGFYSGEVIDVSNSIMLPSELTRSPIALQEPVYIVKARLPEKAVTAFGGHVQLKPGMTLTADIKLSERSIVEWLLEPLYSLKGRV
ncbi:HlyD family efflux transporter periplasmic adaptor subunit [Marinimicrobium sp. C6131]|uniref:HlyD family secretion protein n=1 Tax=Marinimicrobium sp. C6131 TaxID=3022676 RepID=UPI00223CBDC0|nr:HlyD family efflux transporter periplasmic adaptor subunit [Marinimicrobium sp. C6131]UZJ43461.1 HlyD family efflux transporter periplasmic adaptor subunit [Marinimicrobium sp. C6131]